MNELPMLNYAEPTTRRRPKKLLGIVIGVIIGIVGGAVGISLAVSVAKWSEHPSRPLKFIWIFDR